MIKAYKIFFGTPLKWLLISGLVLALESCKKDKAPAMREKPEVELKINDTPVIIKKIKVVHSVTSDLFGPQGNIDICLTAPEDNDVLILSLFSRFERKLSGRFVYIPLRDSDTTPQVIRKSFLFQTKNGSGVSPFVGAQLDSGFVVIIDTLNERRIAGTLEGTIFGGTPVPSGFSYSLINMKRVKIKGRFNAYYYPW